ncbi:MAG: hypothetical protein AAF611_08165 [Bacteroidota bacterium]
MRSLKLKKINISRVGNSHLVFGGAQGQQNQEADRPKTHTLDDKKDHTCKPGTNGGGTIGRTIGVPMENNHGVQN